MPTFNQSSKDNASNAKHHAKDAAKDVQAAAGDASRGVSHKAHEICHTTQKKASEASNAVNQKVEDLRGEQKPADTGIGAKIKETAADACHGVSTGFENTRDWLGLGKDKK